MKPSEVSSVLNGLQTNPNYRSNEAGDNYKDPNKTPPPIEKNLGNSFGSKTARKGLKK